MQRCDTKELAGRSNRVTLNSLLMGSDHAVDGPVTIRSLEPDDYHVVKKICCDTGFLGEPIDTIFQDRELYADLLTLPYLDYERDWCLVAEVDDQVVGYLLGSVRPDFESILTRVGFNVASRMLMNLARGRYSDHPSSRKFVQWIFCSGWKERPKHPAGAAHLHFNVRKRFRGRGIGPRLWKAFEDRLREHQIRSYYGEFFSCDLRRPEKIYTRYGFKEFDRRKTTLFSDALDLPVEIVCMQKFL
ncbi:MAG: GNAT family N-acetyltransferase [Limisphaerales bacterium]